ncbi:MAG: DUF2927 domain-containing protein [Saprospiraceae bacterium]|nr:DUF2927 domain-containing protein [Saprospiraceae bacterium]
MNRTIFCIVVGTSLLVSCQKDADFPDVDPTFELSEYQREIVSYFQEIALGFEFGSASKITRKWVDTMQIFIGGMPSPELLLELDKIISEINELASDHFAISQVQDSLESNFYVFFGSGDEYAAIFPALSDLVKSNWGLFSIQYNSAAELNGGYMYVDIYRANVTEQKHLLREELTQSLGLGNDSSRYDDSIFQSRWTSTNRYAAIDEELIRLLYHPEMTVGLDQLEVREVLTQILINE